MKINISGLMSLINEYDRKINTLSFNVKREVYDISTQELDGTVTVIEKNKEDFTRDLREFENAVSKLTRLKTILYEKNNSYHFDGRTIQSAIVDNCNLRRLESIYTSILENRNSKMRCTEVNNSYFQCKDINYDTLEIRDKLDAIKGKIQTTDLEISKLNSEMFEIDL